MIFHAQGIKKALRPRYVVQGLLVVWVVLSWLGIYLLTDSLHVQRFCHLEVQRDCKGT